MTANGIITLLTDFGTRDGYVGAMKGVVLSEAPRSQLVDVTHDIAPGDIAGGAHALGTAAPWFPAGTIHVAVVDPGVGSERRAIVVRAFGQWFIGPDNGLLSPALRQADAHAHAQVDADDPHHAHLLDRLPAEWHLSSTFHGRDLFARVAGRLAAGAAIDELSATIISDAVLLPTPTAISDEASGLIEGRIVHIDRFGNAVSSVGEALLRAVLTATDAGANTALLAGHFTVEIAGHVLPLVRTYAEVAAGELLGYLGSDGRVEVAVRDGSAAEWLGLRVGDPVRVRVRRS